MKSTASATWKGTGKEGTGVLNSKSGVLNNASYTYKTRFEGAPGTNPEELIAAAHAGCFAMKLSFVLVAAGFTADQLDVSCDVTLESGKVTESALTLKARVPGIDKAKFDECVNDAVKNCPISKLLNTEIKINAELS